MTQARAAAATNRSLAPREHGAYGQLFAPMLASLLATRITFTSLAFAVAGVCAFYAHEPLLVLSGQRGARAERELLLPAKRRAALLLGTFFVLGMAGLWISNAQTRWAAVGVGVLGLSAAILSHLEFLHSAFGEAWAGSVLAALGVPIALAGAMPVRLAIAIALAWSLAFAAGVFAIKGVISYRKTTTRGGAIWGMIAVVTGLVLELKWASGPVMAVTPLTLASVLLLIRVPSPKALRKIGWTLVGFTVLSAALMVLTARARLFESPIGQPAAGPWKFGQNGVASNSFAKAYSFIRILAGACQIALRPPQS